MHGPGFMEHERVNQSEHNGHVRRYSNCTDSEITEGKSHKHFSKMATDTYTYIYIHTLFFFAFEGGKAPVEEARYTRNSIKILS